MNYDRKETSSQVNFTYRWRLNKFEMHMGLMYDFEYEINDTTESNRFDLHQDLLLLIENDGRCLTLNVTFSISILPY